LNEGKNDSIVYARYREDSADNTIKHRPVNTSNIKSEDIEEAFPLFNHIQTKTLDSKNRHQVENKANDNNLNSLLDVPQPISPKSMFIHSQYFIYKFYIIEKYLK